MAPYDEAFTPAGRVRAPYAGALAFDAELEDTGIAIGASRRVPVDPLPRVLTEREWAPPGAGPEQRARRAGGLGRGGGRVGALARRPLRGSPSREPDLPPPGGPPLAVVGFDVV